MNKTIKQIFTGLVSACMMAVFVLGSQFSSLAASAQISFSDPSVMAGKEVMVTMKITSADPLGSSKVMVNYDTSMLEFVSGTGANNGDAGAILLSAAADATGQKVFSFSLKFKALKAGTAKITVSDYEIYDADSQLVTLDKQGDSTVKITPMASASQDAQLKSLRIDPGVLTPEFSPEVVSYTASVGEDVSRLTVSAVVANAGANVQIQGGQELQAGENQVVCHVVAEDGQTVKDYTIIVTKGAGNAAGETVPAAGAVQVTVGDGQYQVAADFDDTLIGTLPGEFTVVSYTYKGQEVKALKSAVGDLTLLYLTAADGQGAFYVYEEAKDALTRFASVTAQPMSVIVLPLAEGITVPDGFTQWEVTIDDVDVDGWIWSNDAAKGSAQDYCIFYGMNQSGEKGFYRYDLQERTVQRFFQDGVSNQKYIELGHTYNSLLRDYNVRFVIIIVLACICLALIVALVLLYLRNRGQGGPRDRYGYGGGLDRDPYDGGDYDRRDRAAVRKRDQEELKKLEEDYYIEEEEEDFEEEDDLPAPLDEDSRPVKPRRPQDPDVEAGDGISIDEFGEEETLEEMERELISVPEDEDEVRAGDDDDFEVVELK